MFLRGKFIRSVNFPRSIHTILRFCKFSSAGKPAPGVKLKLDVASSEGCQKTDGGEVLGYGRNIFMGYINRENDTKVEIGLSPHNQSIYECIGGDDR